MNIFYGLDKNSNTIVCMTQIYSGEHRNEKCSIYFMIHGFNFEYRSFSSKVCILYILFSKINLYKSKWNRVIFKVAEAEQRFKFIQKNVISS